jgi:hypothetical protein
MIGSNFFTVSGRTGLIDQEKVKVSGVPLAFNEET